MARGSVKKRGEVWLFVADVGPDPATGKRRQIKRAGFRTKRDAENALRSLQNDASEGRVPSRSAITVGEYLTQWLATAETRLRTTTYASYEIAVGRITALVGRSPLQALTPLQIEQMYAALGRTREKKGPLSPKSIRNTHVVLRKALSDAERLGLVPRNAAAAAKPPAVPRVEQRTWSAEDVRRFLLSMAGDRLEPLFTVYATTGLRRGEAVGLRWPAIDFDSGSISVQETVSATGGRLVRGTTKTANGRRRVALDKTTMKLLRAHRKRQAEERLAAGELWSNPDEFVFTDEVGGVLHPDWVSAEFQRRVKAAGLPPIRLHDLRHTHATLALKKGVHPKIVSERLGHATIGVTLDLYSHVSPSLDAEAAETVASVIFE